MQFRRSGACDQRRRRVLIEENLLEAELDEGIALPSGKSSDSNSAGLRSYADAALADRQPPLTAVIPRRRWTLAVLALSGLVAITGLEALYANLQLWPRDMWPSEFGALDVQDRGGLAAWFSSLMLALAAFQGVQIYRIRRHKTDDYRGRYRLWLWVPVALFFMATCVATHIQHDLAKLASGIAGIVVPADETLLWPLAYCAVWTLVSLRLAFEIRVSRASLVLLFVATCCYFATAILALVPDLFLDRTVNIMVATTTAMLGHLATFLTVAVYGRHVYLDSQGMVPVREKSPRRQKPRKEDAVRPRASDDGEVDVATSSDRSGEKPSKRIVQTVEKPGKGTAPTRAASDSSAKTRASSSAVREQIDDVPDVISLSDAQPQLQEGESSADQKLSKAERRRLQTRKAA